MYILEERLVYFENVMQLDVDHLSS